MNALDCLITEEKEREHKEELFRDYVGQALWHITTIQHFKTTSDNQMPQYIEMAHPEIKKKDNGPQTAEDIIQYIMNRLGC